MAETTPPAGGADTLAPTQPQPTRQEAAPKETFILAEDTAIRPFSFRASDDDLADLKRRIRATRWPTRELVNDASQGVQLATIQKLADYWANQHDWRKVEARIFSYFDQMQASRAEAAARRNKSDKEQDKTQSPAAPAGKVEG